MSGRNAALRQTPGSKRLRGFLLAAAAMLLGACGKPQPALPVISTVPDFTLTAHSGQPFHGDRTLRGRIWVASFMFTNCTGPCPRMSAQFRMIQNTVQDVPDLALVSFTVDPNRDSVEVLAAYAKRFQARQGHWYFLTGPVDELNRLCQNAFLLGKVDGKDFEHSTRFVLVDRRMRVRGYYQSALQEEVKRLQEDIRRLSREES